MKMTKRVLSMVMAIITLISVMGIAAEAASVSVENTNYGYMVPVNYKGTEVISTVKMYGQYDYINFYIDVEKYFGTYFFYEIYSDKKLTNCIESDYVYFEDRGTYTFSPKIKLKGKYKTKIYYVVTYAARYNEDSGKLVIDANSICQFKLDVNRTTAFDKQKVMLTKTKNTTKGAYIKWSALSGANKYYIYRRSITGSKWTKVGTVSKSKTSFTDTSVKNKNGKYVYTVKAINKKGTASRYHYAGLTCLFAKTPVLSSVEVRYDNTVEVKWKKTSSNAEYYVYRKADGGKWKKVATCTGNSYKDTTAKNGTEYTYTVKAVISSSYGKAVSSYYANDDKAVSYLEAPYIEEVSAVENGVSIKWLPVEGSVSYDIYRKPFDGSTGWKKIDEVASDVNYYVDTTASVTDGEYLYSVRSKAQTNKGSYDYAGVPYVVLQNPAFEVKKSTGGYYLSWQTVPNANKYLVFSREPGGAWKEDAVVGPEFTTELLYFPEPGEREFAVAARYQRYSKVFREYRCVYSDYENNTVILVDYPDLYLSSDVNTDKIRLYWKDVGAEGYNVYKQETYDETAELQLVASLGAEEFEYVDTAVETDVKYTYVVKGIYNGVEQTEGVYPYVCSIYSKESITETVKAYYTANSDKTLDGLQFSGDIENAVFYIYKAETDFWKRISLSSYYEDGEKQYVYNGWSIFDDNNKVKIGVSFLRENGKTAPEDYVLELDKYQPETKVTQECTKNGVKITIEPDADAVSYKLITSHDSLDEDIILNVDGDTPLTCTFNEEEFIYEDTGTSHGNVNIIAFRADGSCIGSGHRLYFAASPHLIDAKRNSDGYPVVKWYTPFMNPDATMHIYRKTPDGEWECIKTVATSNLKTKKFSGYSTKSYYFVDKTAESGVEYTYTVQQEATVWRCANKELFQ